MSELYDILNALSELVYISDPETYELIYVNDPGVKMFQLGDYFGQKCHKVFQNLEEPCPFCTNFLLNLERFYTWEFQNMVTGRHFLLKDKLINLEGGRCARMEIAFDNTVEKERSLALQRRLQMETVLVDCLRELHQAGDIRLSIENILAIVGNFLKAERVYIFSIQGNRMSNTFEWCAPGITAEIENLQGLDVSLMADWVGDFRVGRCHRIPNLEDMKDTHPTSYEVLKAQGIRSLISAPMKSDGELVGYIGVDNPPPENFEVSESFFPSLSFFLTSALVKQQQEDKLTEMGYLDYLTGLNNRNRFLLNQQAMEQDGCQKLGVVYMDLNGLKELNDQYGHTAGDQALCAASSILAQVFGGEHCYRLGGDEFVAMLSPIEEREFSRLVRLLNTLLEDHALSCSVGFRFSPECSDVEGLVREADEMMYSVKKDFYRGRQTPRRYRHSTDTISSLATSQDLENMLRSGRFLIYVQPLVNVESNVCEAGEALVRFLDDNNTIVLPGDFIPHLELADSVYLLDFFMLKSVCRLLKERLDTGLPIVPLSVNLSRSTLAREDFLLNLDELWSQFALPQELVRLEIRDDSDSPDDVAHLLETLTCLREKGYRVVIDDFGYLYSNLYLFTSARFDILKLDRSMILNSNSNRMKSSIIRSVIEVCHSMGISVVAEGVQDEAELQILRELGCDQYQGFLFQPPLPTSSFWAQFVG